MINNVTGFNGYQSQIKSNTNSKNLQNHVSSINFTSNVNEKNASKLLNVAEQLHEFGRSVYSNMIKPHITSSTTKKLHLLRVNTFHKLSELKTSMFMKSIHKN